MPIENLIDGCLSTRLLNTKKENYEDLSFLPDILNQNELWLSADSTLFLLGYEDSIEINTSKSPDYTKDHFPEFFNKLANQKFLEQIAYDTNFLNQEDIQLSIGVLGVKVIIEFAQDIELYIMSETILSYVESYLATSFEEAFPLTEQIIVSVEYKSLNKFFEINSENKRHLQVFVNKHYNYKSIDIAELMDNLIPQLIGGNFTFKDYKEFFSGLYENDEVHERLSLIIEHKNFFTNILTSKPKLFLKDWKKEKTKNYTPKRVESPIELDSQSQEETEIPNFETVTHKNLKSETIIDNQL